MKTRLLALAAAVTLSAISVKPETALACACGCGVFDVGTAAQFPSDEGGVASLEYDFLNQNRNWAGSSKAPSADNDDKKVRTDFITAGVQYLFNRSWGINVKVPYVNRHFETADSGTTQTFEHFSLGDIRVTGLYTGLSDDLSTGIEFGLKLPTGRHTLSGFDRDTAIGTGSTDALLGVYHRDRFGADSPFVWSVHAKADIPFRTQDSYRPGNEYTLSAGISHDAYQLGAGFSAAPLLQLIDSYRVKDTGANANPDNTGYERLVISAGAEFKYAGTALDVNAGYPVFQHVNGDQLVSRFLFQAVVSRAF